MENENNTERPQAIIAEIFGQFERHRNEFLFFCPWCKHHKKKLSVNFDRNVFKCWVCEQSGKDIFFLVKRFGTYEQIKDFRACTIHKDNSLFSELFSEKIVAKKKRTTDLPESFKFLFSGAPKRIFQILKDRGISKEDIFKWKIGYCTSGRCFERIVVPSFNAKGNCNYFAARATSEKQSIPYLLPHDVKKQDVIFNELNIDWDKPIYLTEGVFDAMKIGDNAIPIMGKTLSADSLLMEKLAVFNPTVFLCLDCDRTNKGIINQSIALSEKMLALGMTDVQIIEPYPFKDFGEIPKDQIQKFLSKKIKIENSIDAIFEKFHNIERSL